MDVNLDGYIEYKATKIGSRGNFPIARLPDKISGYCVSAIFLIALFTFLACMFFGTHINDSFNSFVSVLVTACPCALDLATPLATVLGLCAKKRILIKTSAIIEQVPKIDTIVFDKTGNFTYGDLKVSKIFNNSSYAKIELLELIASLESKSSHPISKSFMNLSIENDLILKEVTKSEILEVVGIKGKFSIKRFI